MKTNRLFPIRSLRLLRAALGVLRQHAMSSLEQDPNADDSDSSASVASRAGLYFKLHGSHRPHNMKKPTIKRRKRVQTVLVSRPLHSVVMRPRNSVSMFLFTFRQYFDRASSGCALTTMHS